MVDGRYLTHLEGFPRSVQRAIFEADGHRCRKCKATENLEADHIAPTHHGGQSTGENGQTLCHEWHRLKTYYEEWIKPRSANNLLDPLPSSGTIEALFYVDPGIWNATKRRWEHYGPFLTYEEAWEWAENRWL